MKFRITSEFGMIEDIRNFKPHTGIDLATPMGTELRSIANGIVEKVFDGSGTIGKGVMIKLNDGTKHIYGHLSEVKVKVGESIHSGELLGLSGSTGRSTGAHLHFGVMKDGHYIDPEPWIKQVDAMAGTNPAWYDIEGRIDLAIDNALENMGQHFEDMMVTFLKSLLNVTLDVSYAVTLIGGGILIILYGVTQAKRFGVWAGTLFTISALLKFLFGGVQS